MTLLLPLGCFTAAPSPPLLLCSAVCRELLLPSPRTSFLVLWPAGRRPVSVVETEPRYFYLRSPVGVSPLSSAPLLSLLPASSHSSTLVVAPAAPASGFQKPELSFPPSMFLYPQYLFRFLNFCFWVLDSDSPASASKFWDYRVAPLPPTKFLLLPVSRLVVQPFYYPCPKSLPYCSFRESRVLLAFSVTVSPALGTSHTQQVSMDLSRLSGSNLPNMPEGHVQMGTKNMDRYMQPMLHALMSKWRQKAAETVFVLWLSSLDAFSPSPHKLGKC